MKEYLLVGFGGMLGSMARYMCGGYFAHSFPGARFPLGTFFVNILGCILIGLLAGFVERVTSYNAEIRLLGMTGIIGGFTTFSAFGLETLNLIKAGHVEIAMLYAVASVVLGVSCAYLGLKMAI